MANEPSLTFWDKLAAAGQTIVSDVKAATLPQLQGALTKAYQNQVIDIQAKTAGVASKIATVNAPPPAQPPAAPKTTSAGLSAGALLLIGLVLYLIWKGKQ